MWQDYKPDIRFKVNAALLGAADPAWRCYDDDYAIFEPPPALSVNDHTNTQSTTIYRVDGYASTPPPATATPQQTVQEQGVPPTQEDPALPTTAPATNGRPWP